LAQASRQLCFSVAMGEDLKKLFGVEFSLPEEKELARVQLVRGACVQQLAGITDPAEDVIGDLRIARFLRAESQNVKEATKHYKEFLEWRTTEQAPGGTPEEWRREVIGRDLVDFNRWAHNLVNPWAPAGLCEGENQYQMMMLVVGWGMTDRLKWAEDRPETYPFADDFKFLVQTQEFYMWYLDKRSKELGRTAYMVKMVDLLGEGEDGRQGFMKADKRWWEFVMKRALPMCAKFYCEQDAKILVTNTPGKILAAWKLLKHVFPSRMSIKACIVGNMEKPEAQTEVMRAWPAEFLPAQYGGTLQELKSIWPPLSLEERRRIIDEHHMLTVELPGTMGIESMKSTAEVSPARVSHSRSSFCVSIDEAIEEAANKPDDESLLSVMRQASNRSLEAFAVATGTANFDEEGTEANRACCACLCGPFNTAREDVVVHGQPTRVGFK